MSYKVYFEFSTGLSAPIPVPEGTLRACLSRRDEVERRLGFVVEPDTGSEESRAMGATRWRSTKPREGVSDKEFCLVAKDHNRFVRWFHDLLAGWSKAKRAGKPPRGRWERRRFKTEHDVGEYVLCLEPAADPGPTEALTPEGAAQFWRMLCAIDVPASRWTRSYYVDRMEHVFKVMGGQEDEGVSFDEEPLTPKQRAGVIRLFSQYLDDHGASLEVPNGHGHLAASDDGGYDWCEKCGPMCPDDVGDCRRKKCPLLAERDDAEPEFARRWVVKDKAARVYLPKAGEAWPRAVDRAAKRFDTRDAAEAAAAEHPGRGLVVVPLARR